MPATPSHRNRSLVLSPEDRARLEPQLELARRLAAEQGPLSLESVRDQLLLGDCLELLPRLPEAAADLLIADPPYNLDKNFGATQGRTMTDTDYEAYTVSWLAPCLRVLKPEASLYVFGDWRSSSALYRALRSLGLILRNRIVWERDKGRAASRNWKNAHEEIWFATRGEQYHFDTTAVRQRRRVVAPYRDSAGNPKDWEEGPEGRFRDSAASNIWTDITVPYWSMTENTPHPTQKPEKLLAKLLLASCPPGGLVLDPFLGSGSSAVTALKLGRSFIGIELDPEHARFALRRLEGARVNSRIQGYEEGVFWERNSAPRRGK